MMHRDFAQVQGMVFDIQRYSLHDGPGLRTNVFLKGCPLRCPWCANPESQSMQPELSFSAHNCIDCGQLGESCRTCFAASDSDAGVLAERVTICPTSALHWIGEMRTAGDVIAEVLRDAPFYGEDGGLTLTGGEATMQPTFAEALLQLAKQAGIATALETSGHTQWPVFARLLPLLDLILYDLKHVDCERHRQVTGLGNELILANLRQLAAQNAPLIVRIPLIPGFNADADSLRAMAEFIAELGESVQRVDLLPYHTLGKAKYRALGRPYPWIDHARLTEDHVRDCLAYVATCGVSVTIGG
ncbi:MAG: glycyl-radical enzyme activating protein [Caldilineaceae bacterium]